MPFPSPPWNLRGTMWLSLFAVRSTGSTDRPHGLYGAAFVDYQEGGVLTYRELLVACVVRDGAVPRIHITDIWVDSACSRDGGRALWAIPKELATFRLDDRTRGPVARSGWNASAQGLPVAAAGFTGVHRPAPRVPFRFATSQQREDGTTVVARVSGSAQSTLSVGRWNFDVDGPLGWLHGRRPLASFRMSRFRLTFGI